MLFSGYMPPEYVVHGHFSMKSDVFSFGVIILEIVSGRRNRGFSDPENLLNLLGHVSTMAFLVSTFHLASWSYFSFMFSPFNFDFHDY